MAGLSPLSAIPPRGSSLLATLGGGAHTVFSAGVPNECKNHIYGRQRNHIYGLCLWCSLTTSLSERRKWAQRRTGETAIHQSLGSLLQNKINGETAIHQSLGSLLQSKINGEETGSGTKICVCYREPCNEKALRVRAEGSIMSSPVWVAPLSPPNVAWCLL